MPVRIGLVQIGNVRDVLCSRDLGYVLGIEVRGRDRRLSFLPWIAVDLDADHVSVRSVVSLLSASELALYVDNGVRLSEQIEGDGDMLAVEREGQLGQAPSSNAAA